MTKAIIFPSSNIENNLLKIQVLDRVRLSYRQACYRQAGLSAGRQAWTLTAFILRAKRGGVEKLS